MKTTSGSRSNLTVIQDYIPLLLLGIYLALWTLTAFEPFNRRDWLLENLLVFILVPIFILTYRRFRFSNLSYSLLTIFFIFHAIGAHYTYAKVPFGNWLRDYFDLSRNHYDRLIHFSFGLLITFPIVELVCRKTKLNQSWIAAIAIHAIVAWSAIFEILEAAVALLAAPALGAAYTGMQGDVWDAQKDVALATLGSGICILLIRLKSKMVRESYAGATSLMNQNQLHLLKR